MSNKANNPLLSFKTKNPSFISPMKFCFKLFSSTLSFGIFTNATVRLAITAPSTSMVIMAFNSQTEYNNAATAGLNI